MPGDRLTERLRRQDDRLHRIEGAIATSPKEYRLAARSLLNDNCISPIGDADSDAIVVARGHHCRRGPAVQERNLGRLASDESEWPRLVPRRSGAVSQRPATSGIGQRRRSSARRCKRTGRRSSRSSTLKPKHRPFLPSSWRRSRLFYGAGSWRMGLFWRGAATADGAAQSRFHVVAADSARAVLAAGWSGFHAAHLVDRVIPRCPVRQWVLTVPYSLRARMMFDPALTTVVLRELIAAVSSWLRRRARRLGIKGGSLKTGGVVTVIQRFNSALMGASPHFYTLFLDGVYSFTLGRAPVFHPTPGPTDEDVALVAASVFRRVTRKLAGEEPSPAHQDFIETAPLLAAISQAAVGGASTPPVRGAVNASRFASAARRRPLTRLPSRSSVRRSRSGSTLQAASFVSLPMIAKGSSA